MSIIEAEHGSEQHGSVKRKANVTRDIRSGGRKKTSKTAGEAPEVMAKVTGFSKGSSHAKANIDYISRNGDTEIENERGEVIEGRKEIKAFAKEWVSEFGDGKRYKDQRDTMHLIMSMPEGTDPEAVRRATRQFAKQTFGKNNEYVFALHTDTASPHTHITIKTLGFDGKRLNPRKDDLQRYRESFADAMEEQGYMANATPRNVRGVVKKAKRQVLLHIEKRGASKVQAAKVKEAAQELISESQGVSSGAKPWAERIKATQERVREAWLEAANNLSHPVDQELHNERPRYGRGTDGRRTSNVRSVAEQLRQRGAIAGVHQSGYRASGGTGPAQSVTSMRNLSGSPLVQSQAVSKMLLHTDALDIVADRNGRAADNELRRSGVGIVGNGSRDGEGKEESRSSKKQELVSMATRLSDPELAKMVRTFVAKMPPVETERDHIKRELVTKFSTPVRDQTTKFEKVEPSPDPKDSQNQTDRDLER